MIEMFLVIVSMPLAFALIHIVSHLGRKCNKCGCRKTLTWPTIGPDNMHLVTGFLNRYCFRCAEFTTYEEGAYRYGLGKKLLYKLAVRHYIRKVVKEVYRKNLQELTTSEKELASVSSFFFIYPTTSVRITFTVLRKTTPYFFKKEQLDPVFSYKFY